MGKDDLNFIKYFAGFLSDTTLPTIAKRELFLDYAKTKTLSLDSFDAYKELDLIQVKKDLLKKLPKDKQANASLIEFRIIPKGRTGQERFFLKACSSVRWS